MTSLTRQDVIDFVNANPLAFMATSAGSQPHVRGMMTARADDEGILFATGAGKDVARQLDVNPKVELCYYNREQNMQVRLTGAVERIEDQETKVFVLERFPFLKPWVESEGFDVMVLYLLREGTASQWSMDRAMEDKAVFEF